MLPYVFALIVTLLPAQQGAAPDEIKDGLARAESLYWEAKFVESIQILARVNDALDGKPDRLQDKIATKLQLSLSNIGLNDTASAKTFLTELYALDPEYVVDAKVFAPKIVSLANEAKADQSRIRCELSLQDARRSLTVGDAPGLMNTLKVMRPKCPNLAEVEPDAAELLYKTGLASYKQNDFASAVESFRSALKLSPKHELAAQYVDLTESKLQLNGDRLMLQWQKNFNAREYKAAASDYRQIVALSVGGNNSMLGHVTGEYRKVLSPLVDSWKKSCSTGDAYGMSQAKNHVTELVPDPAFAEDLQSQIKNCTSESQPGGRTVARLDSRTENIVEAPAAPRADANPTCLQMDSPLALTRLKTRVDPEIPQATRAYLQNTQVTIKVKARIDESGSVTAMEVTGTNAVLNNAVRTAVERWKFSPIADRSGPRCVNTEIPIVIGR